jgi:hypothetical protein
MQQLRETKDRPRVVRALEHAAAPRMCRCALPTPRAVAAVFTAAMASAAADLAGFVEADLAAFAGGGLGRRPVIDRREKVAKDVAAQGVSLVVAKHLIAG